MKHLLLPIAFFWLILSPLHSREGWRQFTTDGGLSSNSINTIYWVVAGESEYIELAQDWSHRLGELEQLRSDLRPRVEELTQVFPRQVEEAYRRIWQRWCAGEKASPLSVSKN